jgi:hypothetical protein
VSDLVDVAQTGRGLDLDLDPDALVEPCGRLDHPKHVVDEVHLVSELNLGDHHAVQVLTGVLHDRLQIVGRPLRVDGVDAHDDRLLAPVVILQRIDDVAASLLLGERRDGVLQIHEDLIGREPGSLGQHLGRGTRYRQARPTCTRCQLRPPWNYGCFVSVELFDVAEAAEVVLDLAFFLRG